MKQIWAALVLGLVPMVPAVAFDDASQAVIDRAKVGKLLSIDDVATLMMGAERWCYNQQDYECAWSDIYLSTDADGATFEISHPWSDAVDIAFVSEGVFRDGRYICENAYNWVPSVRAYERGDGWALEGRELAALKAEIAETVDTSDDHACFDYIYRGHDRDEETITLLQRDYAGPDGNVLGEATVTLHFNRDTADELGWYF
ncbi:MAG: hypothetical protein GX970_05250 [Phyllobacteriaceae bacterium]|nr:hypothetical protein [Phyllobacteriaceae bacterium]